jgi:flavin-dependent dehydrogenase
VTDLLVVGGGPVGLVTALTAARAGLRVCVVEAREAPIDKACGEGLMPGALRALSDLGIVVGGVPFYGIRYTDGRANAVADFRDGHGMGVRRTALHTALVRAAEQTPGLELVHGTVTGVEHDGRGVTAHGISARYLVAADGLHSPIRRSMHLARETAATPRWGMRAHFAIQPWSRHVEVHWSRFGEAYVTPVAEDCVGIAVLGSGRGSFDERLAAFPRLRERLPAEPVGRVLGAGPLRQEVVRRAAGRVLLVGDAAGYVDALTGEGLSMGFACAAAAVRRIVEGCPERYEADYRRITRRYRLLTATLVRATASTAVRERIVPVAGALPRVFEAAVAQLAR